MFVYCGVSVLTFPAYNATPCSMQRKTVRRKPNVRRSHTNHSRRPSAQRRGRQEKKKNSASFFAPPISHNTKPYPVTTDCSQCREKGVVFTLPRDPKPGRFYNRPPCRASVPPPAHRRVPPPSATICMSPQAAAKSSQCTRYTSSMNTVLIEKGWLPPTFSYCNISRYRGSIRRDISRYRGSICDT